MKSRYKKCLLKMTAIFDHIPIFVWGGVLSGGLYLLLFGISALNVFNTQWLMDNEDRGLSYLGALFYVFSDWEFPIGLSGGLAHPLKYSIVYVDNIPLAAIISKLILSLSGHMDFQYLGITTFINHILMGAFSSQLISKITESKAGGIASVIFYFVNYPYLTRIFVHFGLQAQWILAALIYFYAVEYDRKWTKKVKISFYFFLGCMTIMIHSYFMPALFISIVFMESGNIRKGKDVFAYIGYIISYVGSCVLILYLLGGVYGKPVYSTGAIGQQSSNLNTFINPSELDTKIFNPLPLYQSGQHNGTIYLGLGIFVIIFLIIIRLVQLKKRNVFKELLVLLIKYWYIVLGLTAVFIFALSPTVTLNDKVLFTIPLPDKILQLWGVFRATGRAAWMILYFIITVCIYGLFKIYKKNISIALLVFCAVLQVIDFSDPIENVAKKHVSSHDNYESGLVSPAWKQMQQLGKDKIIFMNGADRNNDLKVHNLVGPGKVYEIAKYAFDNEMVLNDFYFARVNQEIGENRKKIWRLLYDGIVDEKAIYIFLEDPVKLIQKNTLNFYRIDDFLVGVKETLDNQSKITERDFLSVMPLLGTMMKNGYYEEGCRIINPDGTSSGPDIPLNKGEYILEIRGEKLNNLQIDISAESDCNILSESRGDDLILLEIGFKEDVNHLFILMANEGDQSVRIKSMKIKTGKR